MGHPHYKRDIADGAGSQVSDDGWLAPRLAKALLDAPTATHDYYKTQLEKDVAGGRAKITLRKDYDADLKALLEHIAARLARGVDEAWISTDGYDFRAFKGAVPTPDELGTWADIVQFAVDPEEVWARAFTERVVFSMYALLSEYEHERGERGIYEAVPRAYPICMECQHLSTLCVLSRGIGFDKVSTSFAAGLACSSGSAAYPAFKKGQKFERGTQLTTTKQLVDFGFSPGSIVVFNPGGPNYTAQDKGPTTHVASALRVSGSRVQFIDTGVLSGAGEPSGEGGTVDHTFTNGTIMASTDLVAVGVLGDPGDLGAAAATLAAARPLGFVRLAIVDTSGGDGNALVRFVSKLVHMRYPVARYVWSLRGLPVDGLTVLWFVYLPYGKKLATALIDSDASSPAALMTGHKGKMHLANVIRGEGNGSASIFRRKKGGSANGFIRDLTMSKSPPANPPEMLQGLALTGGKALGAWCMGDASSYDKRYVRRPTDADGTVDDGATGVAFFDA